LKIHYLKSVDSTQTYLKNLILEKKIDLPFGVCSDIQTNGLGSRDNNWSGLDGNLFFSFAVNLNELPNDLKLESSSIYFSQILKQCLEELGSSIWLKWPNDFYIENKKIGGMITNILGDTMICGVGLNLKNAPEDFAILDIKINKEKLLKIYTGNIEKKISWKQIFSKYKINFYLNQNYYTHNKNLRISLKNSELQDDGSIIVDSERIYSLR